MTSEGREMFEGDSADTSSIKFPLMLMGEERTVKRAQTVSEDPHQHEQKFLIYIFLPCTMTPQGCTMGIKKTDVFLKKLQFIHFLLSI
jgi:hypothetical protein